MYGRTYMGNERTTFVISPDGKIKDVLRKVKPAEHDELVLAAWPARQPPDCAAAERGRRLLKALARLAHER